MSRGPKIRTTSPSDLLVFSGAERQSAAYAGHIERAADGQSWVGSLTAKGGGSILLSCRLSNGRLAIIGTHGLTSDEKRLKREEER